MEHSRICQKKRRLGICDADCRWEREHNTESKGGITEQIYEKNEFHLVTL